MNTYRLGQSMSRFCAALLLVGCANPPAMPVVQADPIEFPLTYLGTFKQVKLDVRVDGNLIPPSALSLSADDDIDHDGPFRLDRGPLTGQGLLFFTPTADGDAGATLFANVAGRTTAIPIHGLGAAIPTCPKATTCGEYSFDTDKGTCVVLPRNEYAVCGENNCDRRTCIQGECVVDPSQFAACAQTVAPEALVRREQTPAWLFRADYTIIPPVTLDASGNIYFLDCLRPDPRGDWICDIVSVTSEGRLRWRQKRAVTRLDPPTDQWIGPVILTTPRFLVILQRFRYQTAAVQAYKLNSGALAWTRNDLTPLTIAYDASGVLAVLRDESPTRIVALEQTTGQTLAEYDIGKGWPEQALVGDSAGHMYVSWSTEDHSASLTEVDLRSGPTMSRPAFQSELPWYYFPGHIMMNDSQVLSLTADQTDYKLRTNSILDAVVAATGVGFSRSRVYVAEDSCTLLQSFDSTNGAWGWGCILNHLPDVPMLLTQEGGVALIQSDSAELQFYAADGSRGLFVRLQPFIQKQGSSQFSALEGVGHRWLVTGRSPDGTSIITAYDIPEFEAATQGWTQPRGNVRGTGTPH